MKTRFTVAADHPSLPGHFPGQPVVPGVLLLDAVQSALAAQVGEIAALSLPQVKFLQPLLPDQAADIELTEAAPGRWRFRILRGDELIASGEMAAG
ncbi:MAG: hypothetical protein Q4G62_03165 [Pseudomonadota bacterium]|nr:hypothetical protein [Pseudomonadota bacterium]